MKNPPKPRTHLGCSVPLESNSFTTLLSEEGAYPREGMGFLLRSAEPDKPGNTEKILAKVSKTADKSMQSVWPKFSLRHLNV